MLRRGQSLRRHGEKATIPFWVLIINFNIFGTLACRHIYLVRLRSRSSTNTSYLVLLLDIFLVLGFHKIVGCLLQFERLKLAIIFLELILANKVEGLDLAIVIEQFTILLKIFFTSILLLVPLYCPKQVV